MKKIIEYIASLFGKFACYKQNSSKSLPVTLPEKDKEVATYNTKLVFRPSDKGYGPIAFVHQYKSSGRVVGVSPEDDKPKSACYASPAIAKDIVCGVLYDALVKRRDYNKFDVLSVKVVSYNAKVTSKVVENEKYSVLVKFGNKTIVFNPAMKGSRYGDFDKVLSVLKSRVDISNLTETLDEFMKQSMSVESLYKESYENGLYHGKTTWNCG